MAVDLNKLRVGCKVNLKAPPKGSGYDPANKPYPVGWREVVEHNGKPSLVFAPTIFKVVGESRWLPVILIEEIRP